MSLASRFGQLMQEHRQLRPVATVARKVGCSARTIANMEEGKSMPRLPVYVRLCRWYNLTLAQRAELDELAAGMGVGS